MSAFFHHLTYDFRNGLRNRSLMLMNYLFPLFFYTMMGVLMGGLNPTFKQTMAPAMIVFGALTATVLAMPGPMVSARESGIFRSYKINGVPSLNILIIPMLGTMLHMALCAAIIFVTSKPFFGASLPAVSSLPQFIAVFLVLAFSLAAIGMLIGVVAADTRATMLIGQAIYLPSMMLGDLILPLSMLPKNIQPAALFFPATYAMEAFRSLAMGLTGMIDPTIALLTLLASGVIALGLAAFLFDWDSKNTGRRRPRALAILAMVPFIVTALVYAF